MHDEFTLSVVLATYNGEQFLSEQLDSLRRQNRLPHELVVCDDRSVDHTLEIVRTFARDAPFPVRIFQNSSRLGYADNFLQGASLCEGKFIAFCDQDDSWHESKIAKCALTFEDPAVVLAIHSAEVVDGNLKKSRHRRPNFRRSRVVEPLSIDPFIHPLGFAMVFSSAIIRGVDWRLRPLACTGDITMKMAHDQWIFFLAQVIGRIALLAEPLALYRQHSANTCGAGSGETGEVVALARVTSGRAYSLRASAVGQCAVFLEGLATLQSNIWAPHFKEGAVFYRSLSNCLYSRGRLHQPGSSRIEKLKVIARLTREGTYRSRDAGGMGGRALLKDGAAVLLPNVLFPTA